MRRWRRAGPLAASRPGRPHDRAVQRVDHMLGNLAMANRPEAGGGGGQPDLIR